MIPTRAINRIDWDLILFFVAASLPSLLVAYFLALWLHESFHALVCSLFGIPFSWSLIQVNHAEIKSPWVNSLFNFAGGIGQASVLLFGFWLSIKTEARVASHRISNPQRCFGVILSSEWSFLTWALQGFVNGIWEGFFNTNYQRYYNNPAIEYSIVALCLVISLGIVYRLRQKKNPHKLPSHLLYAQPCRLQNLCETLDFSAVKTSLSLFGL